MQQMLREWLKIRNMHLFFPYLIATICAILFVIILIQRALKCKKDGTPFINFKGYHFFRENYDKVKLWGSVILFVLYIITLPVLHFAWTSVEFKSVLISAVIALAGSWGVWYLFYQVFNITLP